jgi:hypothetical protein
VVDPVRVTGGKRNDVEAEFFGLCLFCSVHAMNGLCEQLITNPPLPSFFKGGRITSPFYKGGRGGFDETDEIDQID